ncbi:MAG: type II toxin-antitoxin system RelE/ParE family toxin [Candidatus Omnitrophota bacterium]|nr:type II toxin-antitoxin system RelE/ParE family toxin [Candidatus Omnitrophota bacterium]
MYKIVLTKNAQKEYSYLYGTNKNIFLRVRAALSSIAQDPHQGKSLRLTLKGKWSYRVGMYRIIYSIEHSILTVLVIDIGHRREVYNR